MNITKNEYWHIQYIKKMRLVKWVAFILIPSLSLVMVYSTIEPYNRYDYIWLLLSVLLLAASAYIVGRIIRPERTHLTFKILISPDSAKDMQGIIEQAGKIAEDPGFLNIDLGNTVMVHEGILYKLELDFSPEGEVLTITEIGEA